MNDSAVIYGGFQGGLDWSLLMPRDASLSDSYKSVGGGFPVYTEKNMLLGIIKEIISPRYI